MTTMAGIHYAPIPDYYDPTFDPFLNDSQSLQSLDELDVLREMTYVLDDDVANNVMHWDGNSPSTSDPARSPGNHSHQAAIDQRAAVSLSPMDPDALILTPESTSMEYVDIASDQFSSLSPESSVGHHDDFVHVRRSRAEPRIRTRRSQNRPPPSSGSGVSSPLSRQMSHPSRESSVSQPTHVTQTSHWPSFTSSSGSGMDDTYAPYSAADDSGFTNHAFANDSSNSTAFIDPTVYPQSLDGINVPFRSYHDASFQPAATYSSAPMMFQPTANFPQQHHQASLYPVQSFPQQFNTASQFIPSTQYGNASSLAYHGHAVAQRIIPPTVPSNASQFAARSSQPASSRSDTLTPTPHRHPIHQQQVSSIEDVDEDVDVITVRPPTRASRPANANAVRAIVKAEPSALSRASQDRVKKGGRQKGSNLNDVSRQKSHAMRKVGACWRCALQRDPCDDGHPCTRCVTRASKPGQTYFFDCDRSKLPDLIHDFLPRASMSAPHQKQTIEDSVATDVLSWDRNNGIDVYLRTGYGPPLRWKVYEFIPATDEYRGMMQFQTDPTTGKFKHGIKYSLPFGLLKLDHSDEMQLEDHLELLMQDDCLRQFGHSFYEEESLTDKGKFQARLLDLMCHLYIETQETLLKALLKDVLRMLIITYIMGHAISVVDETLSSVISSIRHSPTPAQLQKFTSPRLATRQLKFFFSCFRETVYNKLLKWQQSTLHTAGKKEGTWLHTFCATLGFAMVLEEVQTLIQIQAFTDIDKYGKNPDVALRQASNACERIDNRYKLLVGLFQCKYRDKTWGGNGSFGPGTPQMKEQCARDFLGKLRVLVDQRSDYLQQREQGVWDPTGYQQFTTRLTARFLLPFRNLPG